MTAAAYVATVLILAGCCAYAYSVQGGHEQLSCLGWTLAIRVARALLTAAVPAAWAAGRIRGGILRARWAWRCRGHPARPDDGEPLDRDEFCVFAGLAECWRHPARPERSRA